MARNKLVDMIGKPSEEQVERLSGIAMEYLDLNSEVENTAPKSCPCCGAANAHFIKRGFSGRKQRYQCKSCGERIWADDDQGNEDSGHLCQSCYDRYYNTCEDCHRII